MRTSSIKSVASAIVVAVTLTVASPALAARATQPRPNRAGRGETIARAVMNLIKKFGQFTSNAGPSVPLGDPEATPTPTPDPTPSNAQ